MDLKMKSKYPKEYSNLKKNGDQRQRNELSSSRFFRFSRAMRIRLENENQTC